MDSPHAHSDKLPKAVRRGEQALEHMVGGAARLQVITVLAAVLALDAADKGTISAVAGSIKSQFAVGNPEIGLLIALVSFVGAAFTMPIGSLVDRIQRRRLLLVAVALWSVAQALSGIAMSFVFLLATRIALGAIAATAYPATASLTGDYFPSSERARVYGMILAGEMVGTGIGFLIGGEISSLLNWRAPFFVMAALGSVVLLVIWLWLPEPARGGQSWIARGQERLDEPGRKPPPDQGSAGDSEKARNVVQPKAARPRPKLVLQQDPVRRSLWWAIGYVMRIPTYVLLVFASSLAYAYFAGVRAFGMIYLTQHWSVSRATLTGLLVVVGVGGLIGVIGGGRVAEYLLRRKWATVRVTMPGIVLLATVVCFGFAAWTRNLALGVGLLTVAVGMLAAANPPFDAARLDIMHPRLWGRAESGRMVVRGVLEGGAPLAFGYVSKWFAGAHGGTAAGLQQTFLVMLVLLLISSALSIPARRTYPRDVATAMASAERTRSRGRS